MALTLFHFFNPSNVLSPVWTTKLIFREVIFQYNRGRVKSHLRRKKVKKRKCHFSIGSGHLQVPLWRMEVQSEGESSSESKIAKIVTIISNEYCLEVIKGEANDYFFEGQSPK